MSTDLNRYQQDQASLQVSGRLVQGTQERITIKDPTVSDAQDAIAALRKRRETITAEIAAMAQRGPRLQAEVERIDRMLAAAAAPEADQ